MLQTSNTINLSILSIIITVGATLLTQILVWGTLFFRIGRFEGTMTTKTDHIEKELIKADNRLNQVPSKDNISDLKSEVKSIELELVAMRTETNIQWEKHRREHVDQHHWVANSLTAIALERGISLPKRRRSSDTEEG